MSRLVARNQLPFQGRSLAFHHLHTPQRAISFFYPSLRKKKREPRASLNFFARPGHRRSRVYSRVSLVFLSLFFSLPRFSRGTTRAARSMDGGWFCATRGAEFSCPNEQARGTGGPRGAYRRDTREYGVVACRYHRGYSLCIAGG